MPPTFLMRRSASSSFELMYNAFQKAGKNVKLLLHQDGHLTPTYPAGTLVFTSAIPATTRS